MESVLKKFEKKSIDMSKVYGGSSEHYTGTRSVAGPDGTVTSGEEYAYVNDDGSITTAVFKDERIIHMD
ncbi:hypothetical protein [Perlabentimonas gracilis]|uniref:hypothetical protein n=1 Tax=Perlabentimonas gracilis TaxID=2715279 RepID=UPI00140C54D7|nr:hypothetical protein [Perlabentimonas gracilis]NHB70278.1 hypothetical protein [Perlabentimonas gracilis]